MDEWMETNWDERVPIHVSGEFYGVDGFREGEERLRLFELAEVGDVSGKKLVHLHGAISAWIRWGGPATAPA